MAKPTTTSGTATATRTTLPSTCYIAYGTDLAGNLMAVGFVIRDDGLDVIIHALPGETPSD